MLCAVIQHLVDGARVPGGPGFEVRVAGGTRTYARARRVDLEQALAALEPGEPPPARVFERALELLSADELWRADLSAALDAAPADLPTRLVDLERARPRREPSAGASTLALVAHWTDGVGELGRRLCAPLASGGAVLVCSDRRVPDAADVWCDALLDAGLPPRRIALLHGLSPTDLATCAAPPARARIMVDDAEEAGRLRSASADLRWAVDWPRGRALALGSAECPDPATAIDLAFGTRAALGGQMDGRLAVLEVPERRHAATVRELEAAVLELARRTTDRARPVPRAVDRDMERRFELGLQRLLEQGATPVVVAERHGDPLFGPALFVNGEPWMEAVKAPMCAPILVVRRI
jgi:hypothetical protein